MAITPRGITMGTNVSFSSYPTQTWMIDPVTKRISGMTDGLAAMAQAVDIVLNIRRYHWQIYLPSSGNEWRLSEKTSIPPGSPFKRKFETRCCRMIG